MEKLADAGYRCIIAKMPFNLAVFKINAAEEIIEEFPDIENWYIGGHSLGGAMASSFAAKSPDDFLGIVLLGAYAAQDLSNSNLKMLSIYGQEDMVLNRDKFAESKKLSPKDTQYLEIPGGNHAYFGSYGEQAGDGKAYITAEEQQRLTAEAIINFMSYN